MVIVNAYPAKAGEATGQKPQAVAPSPGSTAAGAERAPPPGAETITIIDGSTGKRQEVTVGPAGARPPTKFDAKTISTPATAIAPRLLQTTRHGPGPQGAAEGARPSHPFSPP